MKKSRLFVTISLLSCLLMACSEENSNQSNHSGDVECKDRCEDSVMHYCNGTESQCSYGCNTTGTACDKPVSCKEGCSNGVLTTCNGSVASTQNCPSGACNSEGTDCEAPSGGCVTGCKFGQLTTCTGGVATTQNCPSRACNMAGTDCAPENTCTPSCRDGVATVCNGGVASQEQCSSGTCNPAGTDCQTGGGGDCEFATKCDGDMLKTCDSFHGKITYSCTSMAQTCSTVDGNDFCRETCTQADAGTVKTKCNSNSNGSYTVDYVCTKGADGNYYWDGFSSPTKPCNSGEACNATFTACVVAEPCTPSSYQAKCDNNITSMCSQSNIVEHANCTASGQICVQTSSKEAICVDSDMACTTLGTKKYKCDINNVLEQRPVSVAYTCKNDANNNKYYLDGVKEACGNAGCDPNTGLCIFESSEEGKECTSAYAQHCETSDKGYQLAIYCGKENNYANSTVQAMPCSDSGEFCMVVKTTASGNMADSNGNVAECFKANSKCAEKGKLKTETYSGTTYTMECGEGEDGNLYWVDVNYTMD